jgi:hypothetical protein
MFAYEVISIVGPHQRFTQVLQKLDHVESLKGAVVLDASSVRGVGDQNGPFVHLAVPVIMEFVGKKGYAAGLLLTFGGLLKSQAEMGSGFGAQLTRWLAQHMRPLSGPSRLFLCTDLTF